MVQASATPVRLPYQPKLFVGQRGEDIGRNKEVELVLKKAEDLLQSNQTDAQGRVTIFSGEVGLGKSWLLCQLAYELQQPPFATNFLVYKLKINKANGEEEQNAKLASELNTVLHQFARGIDLKSAALEQAVTLPELSRQIMEATRQRLQHHYLVILIDEVFEANWNFLELLEEYLLGPLAIEKKILIVMAGRGRKFPWATPELRFTADFVNLQPFDQAATHEQIRRCHPVALAQTQTILKFSQGIPLTNSLLAQDNGILAHRHPEAFGAIYDRILESVLSLHPELRELVKILSVLTGFDDDRIVVMSTAYLQTQPPGDSSFATSLQRDGVDLRRDLVVTGLAHYDREEGVHRIDPHLRALAEAYLKQEAPTRWRKLHQAALTFYQEWRDRYPRNAGRWQIQMDYHCQALAAG